MASLAFEQAAKYYEQAFSLLNDQGRDRTAALRPSHLRLRTRSGARAMSAIVEVMRRSRLPDRWADTKRFALAVLGSARPEHPFANANVIDESLIGLYEEAIAALETEDENILRAKLFAHLAGEMLYMPQRDKRQELSRKAVAMARQCGDKAVFAQALHIYASAINDPTTLEERIVLTAEQIALADKLVSLETRWIAAYQRMGALLNAVTSKGPARCSPRLNEMASKFRQAFFIWATAHAFAMISVMSGAPDAEQEVVAAFEVGRAGWPARSENGLSQPAFRDPAGPRATRRIDRTSSRIRADLFPHLPVWRIVLAGLYCETDQLDEARSQMDKLVAWDFKIPLDWTWSSSVFSLAQMCVDLSDRKLAALYYPQLKSVAGQVGVTGIGIVCYGSLALPCAQFAACLSRWREAEDYFNQALAMNERIGARPYLVRTVRSYAHMLLDRNESGDRQFANTLINRGLAEAEQLGMQREIVRLERLRNRLNMPEAVLLDL